MDQDGQLQEIDAAALVLPVRRALDIVAAVVEGREAAPLGGGIAVGTLPNPPLLPIAAWLHTLRVPNKGDETGFSERVIANLRVRRRYFVSSVRLRTFRRTALVTIGSHWPVAVLVSPRKLFV